MGGFGDIELSTVRRTRTVILRRIIDTRNARRAEDIAEQTVLTRALFVVADEGKNDFFKRATTAQRTITHHFHARREDGFGQGRDFVERVTFHLLHALRNDDGLQGTAFKGVIAYRFKRAVFRETNF